MYIFYILHCIYDDIYSKADMSQGQQKMGHGGIPGTAVVSQGRQVARQARQAGSGVPGQVVVQVGNWWRDRRGHGKVGGGMAKGPAVLDGWWHVARWAGGVVGRGAAV